MNTIQTFEKSQIEKEELIIGGGASLASIVYP